MASDTEDSPGLTFALTQLSGHLVELAKEVREGFTDVRVRLDGKLDKADGVRIETRIEEMERDKDRVHTDLYERLSTVEREQERERGRREATEVHRAALLTTKQKWAAAIGTLGVILATAFGPAAEHLLAGH